MDQADHQRVVERAALLHQAQIEAQQSGHPYIRAEHLLLAVLALTDGAGLPVAALRGYIAALPRPGCGAEVKLELTPPTQRLFDAAAPAGALVAVPALLVALVRGAPLVRAAFQAAGVDPAGWLAAYTAKETETDGGNHLNRG